MSGEILEKRLKGRIKELKIDCIGINSVHQTDFSPTSVPYEIRLRVAAKTDSLEMAQLVGEEVEALYTNGAAGGGGVRKYAQEVIGIVSILMDRKEIESKLTIF